MQPTGKKRLFNLTVPLPQTCNAVLNQFDKTESQSNVANKPHVQVGNTQHTVVAGELRIDLAN